MNTHPAASLKLLLVDQSEQRRRILERILRDHGYDQLFVTCGLEDLFSLVTSVRPDVVLIELESPSRDTLEQLHAIQLNQPTPVVMFSQDPDAQTVQSAVDSGVCAYLLEEADRNTVKPAIALAMATFNAYRRLRDEADRYRQRMDSRGEIDVAAKLLMQHQGIAESEAHRAIRKEAMDRNLKLRVVASEIILRHRTGF